jgi:hypothetical protein
MEFLEFRDNMVVMDGKTCVAVARKTVSWGYILRVHNGCWVDPRARTQGLVPGRYPHLMNILTKPEARKIMKALANTGKKSK